MAGTSYAGGLAYDVAGPESGTAPPVVFVHGLGSSRQAFDEVRALLPDVTTNALDLPGHGYSPPPTAPVLPPAELARAVTRWLDALGLPAAHLVGNSLGGWTALELATTGRAASVVALAPAGLWEGYHRRSPIMAVNQALARATRPAFPVLLANRLVRRVTFASGVERFDRLSIETALAAAHAQALAVGYRACDDGMLHNSFTAATDVPADVPVTIVFGDRDRLLPPPANQVRALAPAHARWVRFYRCGHAPMWDAPAETVAEIRATAGI